MNEEFHNKTSMPGWALLTLLATLLFATMATFGTCLEGGYAAPVLPSRAGFLEEQKIFLLTDGDREPLRSLIENGAEFISPWSPLPDNSLPYWIAVSQGLSLPDPMTGWSVELLEEDESWRWYRVLPPATLLQIQQIDLMTHLDEAQVFFSTPGGEIIACSRWHFGRWTCGPEEWLWVGQYEMEIQGVQRSCIWAHPRDNYELNIQFEDLPPLSRINGRYGIADAAADMEGGSPVHLSVEMGDRTRRLTAENQRGFFSYHLSREHNEGEPPTGVRFAISSEDAGRRHFCFTARAFLEHDDPEEVEQSPVDSVGTERERPPAHNRDRIRIQGAQRQQHDEREDESHLPAGTGD